MTAATTGADLDPDGYTAALDALTQGGVVLVSSTAVAINGTVTISRLRAGDYYRVTLGGLAPNCAVSSANPQAVTVSGGGTATVAFAVACAATTGSIRVTTATTGTDLDPDGYSVSVDGGPLQPIAPNASIVISGLPPGSHVVSLGGVAVNCEVTGSTQQTVSVTVGATTEVAFAIACAPVTQLAFMTQWAANGSLVDPDIYVINSNGTGAIQLTANPGWDAEPAWSPDGSKIAFTSARDGNLEIYVMNADGSAPMRLTSDPAADYGPAWSPDGTRIAFGSNRGDGSPRIYVMNADGSNPVPLTNGGDPAWSPDGSRIAFSSNQGGPFGIFVMNADGSGITRLTTPDYSDAQPAWSPDGVKIAFARAECCSYDDFGFVTGLVSNIYVMNADGSGVTRLISDGSDPAWSPDGRKIAYSVFEASLVIVNADGTNPVGLGFGLNPAWRR